MTDEELRVRAIQELEFYKKDDTFMLADITVDLAIKALKQEPCDNAVSRQDVLDLAKKGILVSNGNYESVCKAINELPSVNPQPCEDAIDRAEAIKIASGYCHPANVAKELAKLPPVTPQPKTGHWIETAEEYYKAVNEYGGGVNEDTPYFVDDIACSVCLAKYSVIDNETERFDCCPSCGVKLVEPQERSDKK